MLALLALLAGECQRRSLLPSEQRVVVGTTLLGFQATAWSVAMAFLGKGSILVHLVCAMGTLLIVVGGCGLPIYLTLDRKPSAELV